MIRQPLMSSLPTHSLDSQVDQPAVKEEPDDRLEGESKAARDKRVFEEQMREARATRKAGAAEADAAMLKKNAEIDRQTKELSKKRMSFLMKQADVFGKFVGEDVMRRCATLRASRCGCTLMPSTHKPRPFWAGLHSGCGLRQFQI